MLSNQEVFDKVWQHAQKKKKSQSDSAKTFHSNPKGCLYRGPNETKCFAGALLPDSEYLEKYEGKGIDEINWFDNNISDIPFLQKLQEVHDYYEVDDWNKELEIIAADINLSIPGEN